MAQYIKGFYVSHALASKSVNLLGAISGPSPGVVLVGLGGREPR